MSVFNGKDYDYLFALGRTLYHTDSQITRRAIATVLMAMTESVRGQQIGWPNIGAKYRHLTSYPPSDSEILRIFPKEKI